MTFSISTNQALNYFKEADGKQNPYASQKAQKGDGVTENEAAMHLVDLQNGAGGAERGTKGDLFQTLLTGNGGQGFFSDIAKLDTFTKSISEQDISKLASLDGNPDDVSQNDFNALKNDNSKTTGMTGGQLFNGIKQGLNSGIKAITDIPENLKHLKDDLQNTQQSEKPDVDELIKDQNTRNNERNDKKMEELKKSQAEELKKITDSINQINDTLDKNVNGNQKMTF